MTKEEFYNMNISPYDVLLVDGESVGFPVFDTKNSHFALSEYPNGTTYNIICFEDVKSIEILRRIIK